MHAFSNYPSWYTMIENKLELSRYLQWSLVSANTGTTCTLSFASRVKFKVATISVLGHRKPDRESFEHAASTVGRPMEQLIFIDDSKANIEAAQELGIKAILFTDA